MEVVFVALFDYPAREDGDLDIEQQDKLIIINDKHYKEWWLARNLETGAQGYIPVSFIAREGSLEAQEWFHGRTLRKDAERRLFLPENKDGTFLVRESEQRQGAYSLSILHRPSASSDSGSYESPSVKHYRIEVSEDRPPCYFFPSSTHRKFDSLSSVVDHCRISQKLACQITHACPKPRPVLGDLCRRLAGKDEWEIPRSELRLSRSIGSGQFGKVYLAYWNSARSNSQDASSVEVAVKELRPEGGMSEQSFLEEAAIMKRLRHTNLVRLFGVCTRSNSPRSQSLEPLYIVTEFMKHGSLLSYLQTGYGTKLRLSALVDLMAQVAEGMRYLEQQQFVHRDLAARNILVGEQNIAKIADFGLARFISTNEYNAHEGAKFPIKWTSPEAAHSGTFTHKSDVWSFGVVCWETITFGAVPYNMLSNPDCLKYVCAGHRLDQPNRPTFPMHCPTKLYRKMLECWHIDPHKRPSFAELASFFEAYYNECVERFENQRAETPQNQNPNPNPTSVPNSKPQQAQIQKSHGRKSDPAQLQSQIRKEQSLFQTRSLQMSPASLVASGPNSRPHSATHSNSAVHTSNSSAFSNGHANGHALLSLEDLHITNGHADSSLSEEEDEDVQEDNDPIEDDEFPIEHSSHGSLRDYGSGSGSFHGSHSGSGCVSNGQVAVNGYTVKTSMSSSSLAAANRGSSGNGVISRTTAPKHMNGSNAPTPKSGTPQNLSAAVSPVPNSSEHNSPIIAAPQMVPAHMHAHTHSTPQAYSQIYSTQGTQREASVVPQAAFPVGLGVQTLPFSTVPGTQNLHSIPLPQAQHSPSANTPVTVQVPMALSVPVAQVSFASRPIIPITNSAVNGTGILLPNGQVQPMFKLVYSMPIAHQAQNGMSFPMTIPLPAMVPNANYGILQSQVARPFDQSCSSSNRN